jgi:hypothetical protein
MDITVAHNDDNTNNNGHYTVDHIITIKIE